jgi:hypothetical protein
MNESGIREIIEIGGHYAPHINVHFQSCYKTLAEMCVALMRLTHAEFRSPGLPV